MDFFFKLLDKTINKKLMKERETLREIIDILSKESSGVVRPREHKEFGYGKFYLTEESNTEEQTLKLTYIQPGYKPYQSMMKRYKLTGDSNDRREDYKQFLNDLLIMMCFSKTKEMENHHSFSIADLIHKGLPESYKL